jgi:hypothetical protein
MATELFYENTFTINSDIDTTWKTMGSIFNLAQWHPFMSPTGDSTANTCNYNHTSGPPISAAAELGLFQLCQDSRDDANYTIQMRLPYPLIVRSPFVDIPGMINYWTFSLVQNATNPAHTDLVWNRWYDFSVTSNPELYRSNLTEMSNYLGYSMTQMVYDPATGLLKSPLVP